MNSHTVPFRQKPQLPYPKKSALEVQDMTTHKKLDSKYQSKKSQR